MIQAQPLLADDNVDNDASNPRFNCPQVVSECEWYATNNRNTPDDNRQRRCESPLEARMTVTVAFSLDR